MTFNPLKKKVKVYNNRQQIHLNKSDNYHDEIAFIYSPDEHQDIINDYEAIKSKLDEIKQSDDKKTDMIKDYQSRYQSSLDDVRHEMNQEYEDRINKLQDTINQLNKDVNDCHIIIKEHMNLIKEYEDKISGHNDEVNDYKSVIYDLSNKYNSLRIAIKGTSRLDVFLNRHKRLLNDYPEMTLSSDIKAIDIDSTAEDNKSS